MKTNKSQKIRKIKSLLSGTYEDENYTPKWWVVENGICKDEGYPEKVNIKDTVLYMNTDDKDHYSPPESIYITLNID